MMWRSIRTISDNIGGAPPVSDAEGLAVFRVGSRRSPATGRYAGARLAPCVVQFVPVRITRPGARFRARPRYFSPNQHSSRMTQHVASTRIVIADDHPIFRDGLRRLLESEQGYQIVGEAVDAITAVTLVREHTPDILLLDLFMPYGGGIAALRDLAIDPPPTRIILLTAAIEPGEIVTAVHLGARGIITKDSATALLFKCIQRVLAGEYWLDRGAVGDLVQALVAAGAQEGRRAGPPPLTRRELEIIAT